MNRNIYFLIPLISVFFFQFAGFGVLGISIWTFLEQHQYLYLLLTPANSILIYFLIAAGALIIFVVIVGCCGVCHEKRPILVFVSANNCTLTDTLFLLGLLIFCVLVHFLAPADISNRGHGRNIGVRISGKRADGIVHEFEQYDADDL